MAEVIVALDGMAGEQALDFVDRAGDAASFYKVGLELFSRAGPQVVRDLRSRGKRVFLDLKLHDIPNTVTGAVVAAADLDVEFITVHAAGGARMLHAARDAAEGRLKLVAVTLLTSLSPADVEAVWGRDIRSIRDEVRRLAKLAAATAMDGVVASALETSWVRRSLGSDILVVTPGIRPAGEDRADQRRVATPADAVTAGADYLVVGRPVTRAEDPRAALLSLAAEVTAAESAPS
jgi:orotidine-5'-phosphate decarboxylase